MLKISFWISAGLSVLLGFAYSAIYWLPSLGDLIGRDLSQILRFIDRWWAIAWPWQLFAPALCLLLGIAWLVASILARRKPESSDEPLRRSTITDQAPPTPPTGFDKIMVDAKTHVDQQRSADTSLPTWAVETLPGPTTDSLMVPRDIASFDVPTDPAPAVTTSPAFPPEDVPNGPTSPHPDPASERDAQVESVPESDDAVEAEIEPDDHPEPEEPEIIMDSEPEPVVSETVSEPASHSEAPIPGVAEVKRFLADRQTLTEMAGWVESLVDDVQKPFEQAVADGSFDVGADPAVVRVMYLRMVAAVAEKRMESAQKTAFKQGIAPEAVDLVLKNSRD